MDINDYGPEYSSFPKDFISFKDKVYFVADDGIHGEEIWEYNENDAPKMLKDFNPGKIGSNPQDLIVYKEKLYFTTFDYENRSKFWVFDGINAPTPLELPNNSNSFSPSELTIFNNKLYFRGFDEEHGWELWKYDGINSPSLVKDILVGKNYSYPLGFTEFNEKLYFQAEDGKNGKEVWEMDKDENIKNTENLFGQNGSYPTEFTVFKDRLLFIAGASSYKDIWAYDGENEFVLAKDLYEADFGLNPEFLTVFNGKLYYSGENEENGKELWEFDGINKPHMVKDIFVGISDSSPQYLTVYNNHLMFRAYDGASSKLFEYDGTNDPVPVEDKFSDIVGHSPNHLAVAGDKLYFSARDGYYGEELWSYDGVNIPKLESNINTASKDSYLSNFVEFNGSLYFSAHSIAYGDELWKFDGVNPPSMVVDLYPGDSRHYPSPEPIITFKEKLFFRGRTPESGKFELWVNDKNDGAKLLSEIHPEVNFIFPEQFIIFQEKLYFSARDETNGQELWMYDGENAPILLMDIYPGNAGSDPTDFLVFNSKLYFTARDKHHGRELWECDGMTMPKITADIQVGNYGANPNWKTIFKNKILFSADDGENGREMWEYDGTNPPKMVDNIREWGIGGDYGSSPSYLKVFKEKLFFTADDGLHGGELWVYDGFSGPFMLKDLNQGENPKLAGSAPSSPTILDDNLYFTAGVTGYGRELWVYSGDGDLVMVKDIYPGEKGSYPYNLIVFNEKLYFSALDGIHGRELWYYCPSTTSKIEVTECEGYTSPSGKLLKKSGIFLDTIPNHSCGDSIITINLSIMDTVTMIDTIACGNFLSPSGKYNWTSSGYYSDTLKSSFGCDSIINIDLIIHDLNINVLQDGSTLIAEATGVFYQWLDCESGNKPIPGAINQFFSPEKSGEYAVKISNNSCVDTSSCYSSTPLGIMENNFQEPIQLYPNPTKGNVSIDFGKEIKKLSINLRSINGQVIFNKNFGTSNKIEFEMKIPEGVYFLEINSESGERALFKIIKE